MENSRDVPSRSLEGEGLEDSGRLGLFDRDSPEEELEPPYGGAGEREESDDDAHTAQESRTPGGMSVAEVPIEPSTVSWGQAVTQAFEERRVPSTEGEELVPDYSQMPSRVLDNSGPPSVNAGRERLPNLPGRGNSAGQMLETTPLGQLPGYPSGDSLPGLFQQLVAGQFQMMERLEKLELQSRMASLELGAPMGGAPPSYPGAARDNQSGFTAGLLQGQELLRDVPASSSVGLQAPQPFVGPSCEKSRAESQHSHQVEYMDVDQPKDGTLAQSGPPNQGIVEVNGQKFTWALKPEGLQLVPVTESPNPQPQHASQPQSNRGHTASGSQIMQDTQLSPHTHRLLSRSPGDNIFTSRARSPFTKVNAGEQRQQLVKRTPSPNRRRTSPTGASERRWRSPYRSPNRPHPGTPASAPGRTAQHMTGQLLDDPRFTSRVVGSKRGRGANCSVRERLRTRG